MKRFKPSFSLRNFRRPALLVAILLGFACGPSFDLNEFMSFFMPESATSQPEDSRYFFTPQFYNDPEIAEQYSDSIIVDENITAWASYVRNSLSETQIYKALYREEPEAVSALKAKLERTNSPAVAYLDFAWAADDGQGNPWEPNPTQADSTKLPELLEDARTGYRTTTDAFLKERYAFQAVKLACEIEAYKQAQQLYDQLVKPLSKHTFMSDWALCRRAGATLALGDTAQAIYEFAQVFDRCPSRRKAAETSLRKYGIRFREEAQQFAKTDNERAAVYALCAIQPGQDALEFLKEMVRLTPKSPLIELVMAREINRNEYYFFITDEQYVRNSLSENPDSVRFINRKNESASYFDKLRSFALESAENQALGNASFWYTAAAYLDYIGKDYKAAQSHLDEAVLVPSTNANLKKQITVQRMLLLAAQTETITPETENQLIGYLEEFDTTGNFRLNNAFVSVCKQFATTYRNKTEPKSGWLTGCSRSKTEPVDGPSEAKAYLLTMLTTQAGSDSYFASTTDPNTIEDTVSAATVEQTIAFASQPKTDFDKRLLNLSGLTRDYLSLLLGRRLMMEHQYAKAADAFANVDPKTWANEAFSMYFQQNPFAIKMPQVKTADGSVNFPAEAKENPYTPVQFAKRMAELEQQAKAASGDKAADLYYQLGCGAWNLSWYGNAWLLVKSYWSAGEPPVYDLPSNPVAKQKRIDQLMNTDYYTTAHAKGYFEQSVKAGKTPAITDRSAYMAARCEAHSFSLQRSIEQMRNGYVYEEDSTFVKTMLALRKAKFASAYTNFFKNHRRTAFHKEMIRECAMYKDFLSFGERADQ
ncbi:hypothetical protein EXU85_17925 [Spirosoma sp. KCTC 42546]|uniref:hypothetical protein n=1 Tax=Spirosoma sp. KCTC 42546 TaxID=2520506 RepID=UPI00115C2D9F|nr:hypothetical protein [Spirosoma sp. KCTC 42546]QDK80379.1 hypothetical protein EXU85_17925 [Spirosoma sp. KCTC 42546]